MAYLCEKAVGTERSCDFRSGRIILQRPIEREQMLKLLSTGKTDLLHRFISKKGRPFSAFLVRGADGKVGFAFAPRAGKSGTAVPLKALTRSSEKPTAPASAKSAAKVSKKARGALTETKAPAKAKSGTRRKSLT